MSRESPYFPLRNAVFDIPPYRGHWPEIWVAAHGPRTLRITGRFGDAWFPGFPQTPQEYADRLTIVRTAAADAGRDPMAVLPAVWLFVITGRSRGEVDDVLASEIAKSFALNIPGEFWKGQGFKHPFGQDFPGFADVLPQTLEEETVLAAVAQVPQKLMEAAFLVGTPAEVIDQLGVWRDHGVRYFVLCNISVLQPSLPRALAASIPLRQILRALRAL